MSEHEQQNPEQDIETIAPQKLLGNFTRNRVLKCIGIAVAVHITVIIVTSPRYIYESINPEAKARRVMREKAEREKSKDEAIARPSPRETVEKNKQPESTPGDTGEPSPDSMEARKQTETFRETTEVADPDDVPRQPEDIGISLDDTEF